MSKKLSKTAYTHDRVFVTGGAGFIGSHLVKLFVNHGDEVLIYDSFKSYISPTINPYYPLYLKKRYEFLKNKVNIVEGDIRNFPYLSSTMKKFNPTKIVHLAALPIADKSNKYPQEAVSVNYNGTINVLDALKDLKNLKKFVNISSSMVYGNFKYAPCDEEHPKNPKDVYGATKYAAETMVTVYSHLYNIPYINIRPSAVYGPTDCNQRVVQLFLHKALEKEPLTLHNGGKSRLDFTYVEDTAQGIYLATKNDKIVNETFNITRGEGRSLANLVEIIKQYVPKLKINYREAEVGAKRPERGAMDIAKAKKLLGYSPKISLEAGIKKYFNFLKLFL